MKPDYLQTTRKHKLRLTLFANKILFPNKTIFSIKLNV